MTLFNTKPDTLDGFDAFWALFPRNDKHPNRKSGKQKCKQLWKSRGLWKVKKQVMSALKEDIDGIKKGSFKKYKEGHPMELFPGVHPWLNRGKYDRDIPEPKEPKPRPCVVEPEHRAMTPEEKRALIPMFRKMAKIK